MRTPPVVVDLVRRRAGVEVGRADEGRGLHSGGVAADYTEVTWIADLAGGPAATSGPVIVAGLLALAVVLAGGAVLVGLRRSRRGPVGAGGAPTGPGSGDGADGDTELPLPVVPASVVTPPGATPMAVLPDVTGTMTVLPSPTPKKSPKAPKAAKTAKTAKAAGETKETTAGRGGKTAGGDEADKDASASGGLRVPRRVPPSPAAEAATPPAGVWHGDGVATVLPGSPLPGSALDEVTASLPVLPPAAVPAAVPVAPPEPVSVPAPRSAPEVVPEPAPVPAPPGSLAAVPVPDGSRPAGSPARRNATKRQQVRLAQLTERLGTIDGRVELAETATREAVDLVGADTAALVVHSVSGARVLAVSPQAAGDPEVWGPRTLVALLTRSEPVRLVIGGDPLIGGGRVSLLTAPVPAGGRSAGVLICRRRSGRAFTVADEDALARLARLCGSRLHRTPERAALESSFVDPVTGFGDQDLLRLDLAEAIRTKAEHGLRSSLVATEVVGLSRLRTARGAAAADAALAEVARKVAAGLRVGDLLYRPAADELVVVLPTTGLQSARAVARRLAALQLPGGEDGSELSLRAAALSIKGEVDEIMLAIEGSLKALQIEERWSEPKVVQLSTI